MPIRSPPPPPTANNERPDSIMVCFYSSLRVRNKCWCSLGVVLSDRLVLNLTETLTFSSCRCSLLSHGVKGWGLWFECVSKTTRAGWDVCFTVYCRISRVTLGLGDKTISIIIILINRNTYIYIMLMHCISTVRRNNTSWIDLRFVKCFTVYPAFVVFCSQRRV